jgi:outer membrane receptor protein involved in Fe transport
MANRRLIVTANYTFTKSKLQVGPADTIAVFASSSTKATDYFRNGVPLTGQSNHIANLQIGMENTERLSQQTLMVTYASKRVVSRGQNGNPPQPDVIEAPGLRIDFVMREGFSLFGKEIEGKFEARNLTGRGNLQYQESGKNRIETNTYKLGRTFSLSASMKF